MYELIIVDDEERGRERLLSQHRAEVVTRELEFRCAHAAAVVDPSRLLPRPRPFRAGMPRRCLVLHNLAFILPLALVFIGAYLGLGSARLAELFKRRPAGVKAVTALLFLAFAVLLVL